MAISPKDSRNHSPTTHMSLDRVVLRMMLRYMMIHDVDVDIVREAESIGVDARTR